MLDIIISNTAALIPLSYISLILLGVLMATGLIKALVTSANHRKWHQADRAIKQREAWDKAIVTDSGSILM